MRAKSVNALVLLILLALSFCVPTLTLISTSSKPSEATSSPSKQADVFNGSFSAQSLFLDPGQVSSVSFSICPTIDAPDTTIQFLMPSDLIRLVKGENLWTGNVKKSETITLQLSIATKGQVGASVRALVKASPEGKSYSSSYYLSVSSMSPTPGKNAIPLEQVDPPSALSAPSKSSSKALPPFRPSAPAKLAPGANATAGGVGGWYTFDGYQLYYNDEAGTDVPMRYFYIELWDRNPWYLPNSLVAYTWTDNTGYWSINVYWGESDGIDPYILVYAQDAWFSYAVDGSGNHYTWRSDLGDNLPAGTYSFGTLTPVSGNQACQAVDGVESEGLFVYWNSGINYMRSFVAIHWPSGTWPESYGNDIALPLTWGWDHVTVQHEYGHCIMYALYGGFPATAHGGEMHYIYDEKDGGFAMIEGWAEFMQCVVDNNPDNLVAWQNGHGGNIETNDWYNCIDTGDMDGNNIEGSCASILWDIYDPTSVADKDYLSMGYAPIFGILKDFKPGDMIHFRTAWDTRYPDLDSSKGPLSTIYWNYGIDQDPYAPWGSIMINSGATYTNSRWVTLTLGGDDWGSGVYAMRFSEDKGATWTVWYYYTPSCAYYLSSGDGWKRVDVQYMDYKGLTSKAGVSFDLINLDTTPPTGSIIINAHAHYTTSRLVMLTLSASDANSGVAFMRFSEDGGATWGLWYSYTAHMPFTLSTPGDGLKWIDVQFEDSAGNPSTPGTIFSSITLDTIAPTGKISIYKLTPYTNTLSVLLYLNYSDVTSGVFRVRYGNWGANWTTWQNASATKTWILDSTGGDGYKRVCFQIMDNAGLVSLAYCDGIYLDRAPPTTTINHSPGNSSISLSATDATSGVSATYYKIDAGSWITYTGIFTLNGTGNHTIQYYSIDNAGNQEAKKTLVLHYLTVNINPSGITSISGTGWYDNGTTATTGTAPLNVSSGGNVYTFSTWKKDGNPVAGNPINVSMDAAHTATAFYVNLNFDFSVSASPQTKIIVAGTSATYNVTAALLSGTAQTVSWNASGLPSGATCGFTPPNGYPTFTSTLSISTLGTTPPEDYNITITGTGPTGSRSTTVTLKVMNFTVAPSRFSPNGDGVTDNTTARATFWASLNWTLNVENSNGTVIRQLGTGASLSLTTLWDGKDDGSKTVPDGTYTVVLSGSGFLQKKSVVVDTQPPTVTCSWNPNPFNPHIGETSTLNYTLSEECVVSIKIYDSNGTLVKTLAASATKNAGTYTLTWNGQNEGNTVVAEGTYTCRIYAVDIAGNEVNSTGYQTCSIQVQ